MNIGIVGTGFMGSGLGKLFAQQGHKVLFSFSRSPSKIEQAVSGAGPAARSGTPREAAEFGDVVVLTVGWNAVEEALEALGPLQGKTLLSCVNPLSADYRQLVVGTTTSGAEEIARRVPEAHVVEAFLNVFAGILHSDTVRFGSDRPSVFYCGDDQRAKTDVARLIEDIGFEPVDSGRLSNARFVEPTAMLLLQLGVFLGMAKEWKPGEFTDLSIKLLRR